MKTYLVAGRKDINLTQELEKYGQTEIISKIFNVYSLATEVSIDEINKIDGVLRSKEECVGTLI